MRGTIFAGLILLLISPPCFGLEINSRYTTLIYNDEGQLKEFSRKALKNAPPSGKGSAFPNDVTGKLDTLIDRVIKLLVQNRPTEQLKFRMILLGSETDVQKIYTDKYGKGAEYVAFYSPQDNTLFISVDDARPGVLAHELAHVIIRNFFYNTPTKMVHEALAQFVESRLEE